MSANVISLSRRLTKAEASRRLGVPVCAVSRLIGSGELKTVPRVANERAIVLESSVNDLLTRLTNQAS